TANASSTARNRRSWAPTPATCLPRPATPARRSRRSWQKESSADPLPRPVRARLRPVAAELHRAPARGAVLRVVVERPAAVVVAAALEPGPASVQHGQERHGEDAAD